jgi:hypothetical protein
VSLLSSAGVSIEEISRLVGHASTVVTEKVYRKELRPVLTRGADAMDVVFRSDAIDRQVADSDEQSTDDEMEDPPVTWENVGWAYLDLN